MWARTALGSEEGSCLPRPAIEAGRPSVIPIADAVVSKTDINEFTHHCQPSNPLSCLHRVVVAVEVVAAEQRRRALNSWIAQSDRLWRVGHSSLFTRY